MTRRGFTMTETIAIFALLAILMSIGWATFRAVDQGAVGKRTQTELLQIASSAGGWELARGFFPDREQLKEIEPQFTFVGQNASTEAGEYSTSVATLDGADVLGLAGVTDDGVCYTLTQPPLDLVDIEVVKRRFQSSPSEPCTGAAAFIGGGDSW